MNAPRETNNTNRLAGLDGLRGIACLMVFLYHLRWHARPLDDTPLQIPVLGVNLEPALTRADVGVAIFFALSGLLLSLPYWRSILQNTAWPHIGQFLWRRTCRIIPAYYTVLGVVYLLREGTYTFHGALDFFLHITFLHNFTEFSYHSVLGVLWTIGIEYQFYLLLPLLMAALASLWNKTGPWFASGLFMALMWLCDVCAVWALSTLAPSVPDRFLADSDSLITGGTVFSYLKLFAFGILAAPLILQPRWGNRAATALALVGIGGILMLLIIGKEAAWRQVAPTAWPLNALFITCLIVGVATSSTAARWFSARWLIATGTISYGIYLWHDLVLRAVFRGTLKNNFDGWALFIIGGFVALSVTLLIATISWRWIERPALQSPYPWKR